MEGLPMPLTTRTATHDHQYTPVSALNGFRLTLKVDYFVDTDDPCKILGFNNLDIKMHNAGPGWGLTSDSTGHSYNLVVKPDCINRHGLANYQDELYVWGRVNAAWTTPGIPTPWGSIGSVTIDTAQIGLHMRIKPDGAIKKSVT